MQQTGNHIVYTHQVSLGNLTTEQFLLLAYRAATPLKWLVRSTNADGITYKTGVSTITLKITDTIAFIHTAQQQDYYYQEDTTRQLTADLEQTIFRLTDEWELKNRSKPATRYENWGALLPSKTYKVTPVLVYLNIAVFVLMVLSGVSPLHPKATTLIDWGGNYLPAIKDGQWWRLVTYMFLHGGGAHLLGNLFGLLYAGMHLEPLIGKTRLAAAYLVTGVCAGIMSLAFHGHSVGVGASGAIFGLYGVFLALLTTGHIERNARRTMLRVLLLFVVYNLGMGMQGNTDNAAHIGGLLSGALIGYLFYPFIKKQRSVQKRGSRITL